MSMFYCKMTYDRKLSLALTIPATVEIDGETYDLHLGGEGLTIRNHDYRGKVDVDLSEIVLEAVRVLKKRGGKKTE